MKEKIKQSIICVLSLLVLTTPITANPLLNQQINSEIQQSLSKKNIKKTLSKYNKNTSNRVEKENKNNHNKKDQNVDFNTIENENQELEENEEESIKLSTIEKKLNKPKIHDEVNLPNYYFNPKNVRESTLSEKNIQNKAYLKKTNSNKEFSEEKDLENKVLTIPSSNKTKDPPIIKQFGYDLFNKEPSYSPLDMTIPVNDDYILGAGDNLIIRVWGKIEQQIDVTIDNNGKIYIPKTGNIILSGVTYKQAHTVIKKALQKHYVNFELSITMGTLKTIKVFILGEATNPGAYDISSLSTLFTALHAAGGPTKRGTLRKIQLKRNNKTITSVDLYKYLLSGNNAHDHKLKNYDTIFIPPIGEVIKIYGEVKRPAIYELNGSTSLHSAIYKLAGGVWGTSDQSIISVKRITKSKHRTFLNIETTDKNIKKALKQTLLKNNDQIEISSILDEEKNTVRIIGEIQKPGIYAYSPNMTLYDLIEKASGIKANANKKKIKLFRYISNTQRHLLIINGNNKETLINTPLNDWDVIKIDELRHDYVFIQGSVLAPGTYQRFENLKVSDLIQLATLSDSAANIGELIKYDKSGQNKVISLDIKDILSNKASTSNYILEANDTIFIPDNPNLKTVKSVTIKGEIKYAGTYIISEDESLENIINRAGGLTDKALLNGLELNRKKLKDQEISGQRYFLEEEQKRNLFNQTNILDNSDFNISKTMQFINAQEKKAKGRIVINFKDKNSLEKITLEHNDEIIIPKKTNIIPVIGGVQTSRGVYFKKNKSPRYYINKSGGKNQFALKRTVYVFKANGVIKKNPSKIEQGDTVYVPQEIKASFSNRFESIKTTLSILSNTLQSIILIQQLSN
tara:strand:- start:53 stop:2620 length:2568 start_codon:yes stop_codon:yes gene_type:complete